MKKLSLQIFALTILFISQTVGQSFNYPEAVVFDYENMRWLVSSYEGGRILQLDLDGNLAYFNEANLDHPRGMKIMNDVLYVTASTEIKGFSLVSGVEVFNLFIPGATFLNDVECDDEGHLYISGTYSSKVYKVYLSSSSYTVFADVGYAPNGLLMDKTNNQLLTCHWGANAPIKGISLSDSIVSTIVNTGLSNLDGMARNSKGDIYVSSQGNNAIYRYDPDFLNPPEWIAGGFYAICDICIEPNSDLLAAADMNANSIEFITSEMGGNLINVSAGQNTIQAALDIAEDGDLILVNSGTYSENLNFKGKNVNLSSRYIFNNDTEFIDNTIIDGSNPIHPDTASCVLFINGETEMATIQGFTITGGMGTKWDDEHGAGLFTEGGGILVQYASPTIKSNKIIFNFAINTSGTVSAGGGAIRAGDSNPLIQNNVIVYNQGRYGAGIVLNYSGAIIRNNIINHNSGGEDFGGGGIWSYGNSTAPKIFQNNTITNNHSETGGGGIRLWSSTAEVSNSIIWNNTASTSPQIQGNDGIFSYCDIQGGWPGIQNIDADPIFDSLNFYLIPGSPCIDAGNPDIDLNDPEDPFNSGQAAFPSMGNLSNDMGAYGGPHRQTLVEYTVISHSCLPEGITFTAQEEIDSFQTDYPYCSEIEGDVTISGDDIDDLIGIEILIAIGGDLNISSNDILNNLSGLDSITSIGGNLEIINNPVLSELTGLNNITSIGGNLEIIGNEVITSLLGLENIESESIVDLSIWSNITLSECDIWNICYYLNNTIDSIDIHDNIGECETLEDVIEACITDIIELSVTEVLNICPNPLGSNVIISYNLKQSSYVTLTILDLSGKEISILINEVQDQGEQKVKYNSHGLKPGVYFCVLKSNEGIHTRKIIKL